MPAFIALVSTIDTEPNSLPGLRSRGSLGSSVSHPTDALLSCRGASDPPPGNAPEEVGGNDRWRSIFLF